MENQPSNAGMWSEWSKWLQFPPQDGAHGELGPNGGGSGSTVQPRDVRNVISEIEGESMVIIIAGEILAAPGYTVT